MDSVTSYAKKVVAGKIIAGDSVKKACKRHLKDLKKSKRKDYPYFFDAEQAEYCFAFAKNYCRHSKGKWAGKPLILEDWQRFVVGSIFGWKRKDDDTRRFRYFYIQVARKNGKSTLMAFIGLYVIVCDGENGAEIYSAATKKDQARIIFDEAKNMIGKSPELRTILTTYRNNITFDAQLSKFEPLSSDSETLDGLNVHLGLIDELHAHKTGDVYNILDSATGARTQPLIGTGTTAGRNPNCFCKELYDYYKNILNETVENEDIFIYIAELDENDDWTDPQNWIKANPNINVSVNLKDMESVYTASKNIPSKLNEFKCKKLNMWVTDTASWANMEQYNKPPTLKITKEDLIGKKCYAAGDLSVRNDLASVVFEFPLSDGYFAVLHHDFIPEDKIFDNSQKHHIDYQRYIDMGYITATPGNAVDFDYIEDYILRMREKYDILEVCLDPWNATQLMSHLIDEGMKVVEVRQGFKTLSEPTKELGITIEDRKLIHFDDPMLKWAVGNTVVTFDENGNVRPNKAKSINKIDPAMALIIAHTRAYTHELNYVDVNAIAAAQLAEYEEMLRGQI